MDTGVQGKAITPLDKSLPLDKLEPPLRHQCLLKKKKTQSLRSLQTVSRLVLPWMLDSMSLLCP